MTMQRIVGPVSVTIGGKAFGLLDARGLSYSREVADDAPPLGSLEPVRATLELDGGCMIPWRAWRAMTGQRRWELRERRRRTRRKKCRNPHRGRL